MFKKTIHSVIAAGILSTALGIQSPVHAGGGLFTISLGDNTDLCIGVLSCLFSEADDHGRDSDGTADHRGESTGEESGEERENTVVHVGPRVRDHRTTTNVRDHRTTGNQPDPRPNETVPAERPRYECGYGTALLQGAGFVSISAYDCEGDEYHYTAKKHRSLYTAEMNAFTAEMEVHIAGIMP